MRMLSKLCDPLGSMNTGAGGYQHSREGSEAAANADRELFARHGDSFYRPIQSRMIRTVIRLKPYSSERIWNGRNLLCANLALHPDREERTGVDRESVTTPRR
jgi:hypothetical protein